MLCNDASLQVHPLKACKFTAYRCILWKLVNLQLIGLYFTARMFVGCNLLPSWTGTLPSTWCCARIWDPPGNPWKTIKIQACSQYPQKSLKVSPRPPKYSKMWSQILPQDTKLVNKWKKWNHSKTTVFTRVIAHTATGFRQHFHPWIIKNMDLETVSHFDTLNERQMTKMSPNGSQETPKRHPKIDKNRLLDLKVSVWCPCGPLYHQNDHSGYQNGASRSPKW